MKIQLTDDFQNLPKITQIKSGYVSMFRLVLFILITILTLGLAAILYLKFYKVRNFVHANIFVQSDQASEIQHFLIADSYEFVGEHRSVIYELHIIKPYFRHKQNPVSITPDLQQSLLGQATQFDIMYLRHKGQKYYVNVKDKEITLFSLKFRPNKLFSQYCLEGLNERQIEVSKSIYGQSSKFGFGYFTGFRKIIYHNQFRFVFMVLAFKRLIFGIIFHGNKVQTGSDDSGQLNYEHMFATFSIGGQILVTLILMAAFSLRLKKEQNKIHKKLDEEIVYEVVRSGQSIELHLHQLMVGDLVKTKAGQIIYMEGILISQSSKQMYAIVNEQLFNQIDQPVQKYPLENNGSQVFDYNVIRPGSRILNQGAVSQNKPIPQPSNDNINKDKTKKTITQASIKAQDDDSSNQATKLCLIVTDNRHAQKFFEEYKSSSTYSNFSSMRHSYDRQHLIFGGSFLIVSLLMVFIAAYGQRAQERTHIVDLILMPIIMCFPFNMLFFSLIGDAISIFRLDREDVITVNPTIQDVAICKELTLALSAFEETQFSGFLSKENMFGQNMPDRFENPVGVFEQFRRTRSDSIFTFFANCGIMNLPILQKDQISAYLFKHFGFKFRQVSQYSDEEVPRLVNQNEQKFKVDWSEFKRFPINEKLIETVLIQDHYNDKVILISQGYFTHDNCEDYFSSVSSQNRPEYLSNMRRNLLRGKKIRYLCLKRNFIPNEEEVDQDTKISRNDVQHRLVYAGNIVFDEWANQNNFKIMQQLSNPSSGSGCHTSFLSMKNQNELYGYDHLLQDQTLLYGQSSIDRVNFIKKAKKKSPGVIHVGSGLTDQAAVLASDVSMNIKSQSPCQSDFYLSRPEQIPKVIQEGRWKLDTITLSIVCLTMINFSKILGETVLYVNSKLSRQGIFDDLLLEVGITIVPILLLNLYRPRKLNVHSSNEFMRADWLFSIIMCLICLGTFYVILFMGHVFSCQGDNSRMVNLPSSHVPEQTLELRHFKSSFSTHEIKIFQIPPELSLQSLNLCEVTIYFINVSFAFLVILIMDHQTPSRRASIWLRHLNKLYILGIWIGTIVYYQIQVLKVLKTLIVLLFIAGFMWLIRIWVKRNENYQKQAEEENKEVQEPSMEQD